MSKKSSPFLADAATPNDAGTLLDYHEAAAFHEDLCRNEFCALQDIYECSTDILGEIATLRKHFFSTNTGTELHYGDPITNRFEQLISNINILRCQFCDFMVAAKKELDKAKTDRKRRRELIMLAAQTKSEENHERSNTTKKGADENGR